MGNRQQIQDIPGALRVTFEKARSEYEGAIRQVRWADGPVYVCGTGKCAALGRTAHYALEMLLGLPVVARPIEVFETYSLSLLKQRSVLLLIAAGSDVPEAEELARVAKQRGADLVVMTNAPEGALAKAADQLLLVRAEGDGDTPAVVACLHAALNFLALTAARLLRRHESQWDALAREFEQLPTQIDWVLMQLPVAVRSMAADLARFKHPCIVGGGPYQFPACRAAERLRNLAGLEAKAVEASEFWNGIAGLARRDDAVLFLSGSRSKIKKLAERSATQARVNGARLFAFTDRDDRELSEQADLGILVPTLMELTGCTLSLCLAELLAVEVARAGKRPPAAS
jgi:glutamine---fructose-6-phosphate transaminase (isomerizing)